MMLENKHGVDMSSSYLRLRSNPWILNMVLQFWQCPESPPLGTYISCFLVLYLVEMSPACCKLCGLIADF